MHNIPMRAPLDSAVLEEYQGLRFCSPEIPDHRRHELGLADQNKGHDLHAC